MTQQNTPARWYPDPTGRHELRYFNGQWTQHVSTGGVNSIDPLTESPAPSASTPVSTQVQTPSGPGAQSGPGTPPYVQSAASTRKRSPKFKLAIVGGVVAVAVGITLAVSLTGGGSGGHGFCADAAALGKEYPSQLSAADRRNVSKLSEIASRFDTMAAESASPQNAADLRLWARWLREIATGDYSGGTASQAQIIASSDRVNTYIDDTCPGLYVGGS